MNTSNPLFDPISRLGLGAWAIGGPYEFGWGPVDDHESIETIQLACAKGMTWVDTAPAYGYGHSERIVGQAIKDLPRRPKIFTKCGRIWNSAGKVTSDLRPDSINRQCEESMQRLGVEAIDLYQVHRPDTVTGTPLAISWAALTKLREQGRVKALGLSNVTLEQYRECSAISKVDSLQLPVNILRPGDVAIRQAAEADGAIVLAYSPMESGLLTGKFDRARVDSLPLDDWRKKSTKFSQEGLDEASRIVDELAKISRKTGYSVSALAVAWVLKQTAVTCAIIGARYPHQLSDWLVASSINLAPDEWKNIDCLD